MSVVEKPCLSLEGEGSLFFKPTAVGSRSQSPYRVRNLTRLPLRFRWRIPGPDQRVISVAPDTGVLQPNETMVREKEGLVGRRLTFIVKNLSLEAELGDF